jgi:hypothetical protein
MLIDLADDDSSGMAAAFIAGTLERFGFGDRWAFHALHDDGRCYGLSVEHLDRLYRAAALIINLHGGTEPRAGRSSTRTPVSGTSCRLVKAFSPSPRSTTSSPRWRRSKAITSGTLAPRARSLVSISNRDACSNASLNRWACPASRRAL